MNPQQQTSKPDGLPRESWWVEALREQFTAQCQREWDRMRWSKAARQIGVPMVVGQLDGKGTRTS